MFLLRPIIYLLVTIFLYSVVRAVAKIVLHGFGVAMQGAIPREGSSPVTQAEVPLTGELKRDPVCGTFIAAASSVKQVADGKTFHFCSAACRDKYVASLARWRLYDAPVVWLFELRGDWIGWMKLSALAEALGCELAGDGEIEITGVAGIEHAGPSDLTFLANPKYTHKVKHTRAAAILISDPPRNLPIASVLSANPYFDFARALDLFYQPPRPRPGVHPSAAITASATVGTDASIGAFAVIGEDVTIGRGAIIHPHVVIYTGVTIGDYFYAHSHAVVREYCRIGNRVTLGNGVVVGGDGFGFAKTKEGTHFKIAQSGVTVIEDDVEIQSLSSVDRATVGETRVKRGARIDSLVQVGHASVVGEDNIICAQTGLAGSSVLGKNVLLAGQVGVSGHLTIHDNATVYAQSGVGGDVQSGAVISGSPAFEAPEWLRAAAAFPKLPELLKTVRQLERRLQKLEESASRTE